MQAFTAIKTRRSVRRFGRSKKVTDTQIEKLLEAARWAPSAGNLQSRYFVVVKDNKTKKKLVLASLGQVFIAQAAVVIVACADLKRVRPYGRRGRELYAIQDATIALYNIWLAATEMGLGGVWVGAFKEKLVSKILKLEKSLRPVAILPLGYPKKIPSATSRKPIEGFFKEI